MQFQNSVIIKVRERPAYVQVAKLNAQVSEYHSEEDAGSSSVLLAEHTLRPIHWPRGFLNVDIFDTSSY